MHPNLINLLPQGKVRSFMRMYYVRLVTVAACIGTFLLIAHGALLLPTYVYLQSQIHLHEAEVAKLTATPEKGEDKDVTTKLAKLAQNANEIKALAGRTPAVSLFEKLLAVPHPRVSITALSYTEATAKKGAVLALTGIASTRDDLRAYQLALQNQPFIASADLPVSTYAKDVNISFTISITLTKP